MEFTLLNFFKLITGKDGTLGRYVTQVQLVSAITGIDPSYMSNILSDKSQISDDRRANIRATSQIELLDCITAQKHENDLHNLCNAVNAMSNIPDDIKQNLTKLIELDNRITKDKFDNVFSEIIDYLTAPTLHEEKHNSINDECKQAIIDRMNDFKSSVYLSLSYRLEKISIDIKKDTCARAIYTKEIFENPNKEKVFYSLRRVTEKAGYKNDDIGYLKKKYEGIIIKINDKDFLDYIREYVHKYPETESKYKSFINNEVSIYDLFQIGQRNVKVGVAFTDLITELEVPLDYEMTEIKLEIWYTSNDSLEFDRSGYTFRLRFPCNHIDHNYRIFPENKWELSILDHQPFYIPADKLSIPKSDTLEEDKSHARYFSTHWLLPGVGYSRRYFFHKPSTVDSYRLEFLE
jgi:hypothetical protein